MALPHKESEMFNVIAYIPDNTVTVSCPNAAPRNAHYWRGEVERCREVTIHPACKHKADIALAYAEKGIPTIEWASNIYEESPRDYGDIKTNMWEGQDVVIIGGGPSLKDFDFASLANFDGKVIAVNRAYEFYPQADILFSMDKQFFDWAFRGEFGADAKEKYISLKGYLVGTTSKNPLDKRIINIGRGTQRLSRTISNGLYTGGNSGFAALHLATILGAKRIYLIGYDCTKTTTGNTQHFHSGYATSQGDDVYGRFVKSFNDMSSQIKEQCEVINCNPASGIKCFDFGELPIMKPKKKTRRRKAK